jgi:outer membrane protein assembly factor BamB
MMCFNEADGKFLWQAVHDKLPSGQVNDWPREGICSSPYVEGNRLYYVSNRCEVVCADTEGFLDGKNDGVQDEKYKGERDADVVWRLDMMGELGVFPHNLATCSPLAVGDTLFLITSNGVDKDHINLPKPEAPSFLAVEKKTGKVKWKSNVTTANLLKPGADLKELSDKGLVVMHGQWSNPVYAEVEGKGQIIFPGGDGWVYAFEPDSDKIIWKFDCNPKSAVYILGGEGTRNDFVSTPVVHDNRLYIGVGQDPEHDLGVGHFWCIDLVKATKVGGDVSPVNDNFDPKAGANKKSALAWHYGGVIDPPPEEGRTYRFGRTMSTAAVHDGLCYLGEQEGILHCLDAKTGEKYWEHDMEAATWSSPYWVDGKVYMGHDKRKVLIFEHGKGKKKLGEVNMGGLVRATPTVVNGVLYVMTENKLYAIAR